MTDEEWLDYIALKEWKVRQAESGDVFQAKEVLKDATVLLRDVILGVQPRADLLPSGRFLLSALELILDGVSTDNALGLKNDGRPRVDTTTRDTLLFFRVGEYYDSMEIKNVALAQRAIARKHKLNHSLVRSAWEANGGREGWLEMKS